MTVQLPLLRSPPFPRIDPQVGAVSVLSRQPATHTPGSPEQFDTLIAQVQAARVGGSFWAPPLAANETFDIVIRPRSAIDLDAMVARALGEVEPFRVVALLPPGARMHRVARRWSARGIRVRTCGVDPWSLLWPGVTVLLHQGDEYLPLAVLTGASARIAERDWSTPSPDEQRLSVETALSRQVSYRDPFTGASATIDSAIGQLAEWRRLLDANRRIAVATGISWWKRATIERFLWAEREQPFRFVRSTPSAVSIARKHGGAIALWPSRAPAGLGPAAVGAGVPLHRIEDGFVRSVGLGVNLHTPFSIVVDDRGIYYDPSPPSALEHILANASFDEPLLRRAAALRETILRERISKYDAGGTPPDVPARGTRPRVLVAGQVEDDQSVALGGADVRGNLDLLTRARAADPDAEIWYKPHPDVDAGHRRGAIPDDEALRHADHVVRGGSMAALLENVDGVHVLTSLTGFEALMRGLPVTAHGQPFFAGWGLTRDLAPSLPRRHRRLTLDALVAGALILYPRYLDPATGLPCPPEVLLQRFSQPEAGHSTWLTRIRHWEGRMRRSLRQRFA